MRTKPPYPQRVFMQQRQAGFARLVGAAGKAVVYQWEARKRTPSPLFWQRIIALRVPAVSPSATGARPQEHLR